MAKAFDVGSIVAELELDKKGWDQSVQSVEQDQKTMADLAKKQSEAMTKMGKAMTVAGAAIVGALGLMVNKASEAQETTAKFGTVFEEVFEKANKSAKDLAENYGISSLAAKTMLASTGDLLTGLGLSADAALDLSTQTQQLSVDLASFTNFSGGAAGASDALTKAMLGERESVKALGIVITEEMVKERLLMMGKKELTGQALLQAKAEATLLIAISQSKNAIGDYSRTSDSLANKQRELKARFEDVVVMLGDKLVPLITKVVTKITEIVKSFSTWIEKNPKLAETIMKVSLAVGAILLVGGPLLIIAGKLAGALTALGISGTAAGAGATVGATGITIFGVALKSLLGPIAIAIAAITGLIIVGKLIVKNWDGIKKFLVNIWKSISGFFVKIWTDIKNFFVAVWSGIQNAVGPKITKLIKIITLPFVVVVKTFKTIGKGIVGVFVWIFEQLKKHGKSIIKAITAPYRLAFEAIKKIFTSIRDWIVDKFNKLKEFLSNIPFVKKFVKGFKDGMEEIKESAKNASDVVKEHIADISSESFKAGQAFAKHAIKTGLLKKAFDELKSKGSPLASMFEFLSEKSDESSKSFDDQSGTVENLASKTKEWIDYIKSVGLKTIEEQTDRTETLKTVLGELDQAYKDGLIGLNEYNIAIKKVKDEMQGFSETVVDTAIPAARDMSAALVNAVGEIKGKIPEVGEIVEKTFIEVKSYTDNLINDISNSFGQFVGNLFQKGMTLGEKLKGLWTGIKDSFISMVADMAKDFALNFVKKIITGTLATSQAMTATSKVFQSVGKSVAGIGKGIGKLIEGLAKGIGGALEALATAIANSARILAAAAPQLLIVGAVALALFAGFKAIQSLFGGGGGKAKGKATEMLQDIRNKLYEIWNSAQWVFKAFLGEQQARFDSMLEKFNWMVDQNKERQQTLKSIENILDDIRTNTKGGGDIGKVVNAIDESNSYLKDIADDIAGVLKNIRNLPGAAKGGYFPRRTIATIAEEVPEIVAPVPVLQKIIQGGTPRSSQSPQHAEINITLENTFHIQTLDPKTMRDVVREQIEPELLESFAVGIGKTKMKQILGVS